LSSLHESRNKILDKKQDSGFILRKNLLFYEERLVIPDKNNLRTRLIKKAYNQVSTAYLERDKIHRLLRLRYY
jgi:hypothetical protein